MFCSPRSLATGLLKTNRPIFSSKKTSIASFRNLSSTPLFPHQITQKNVRTSNIIFKPLIPVRHFSNSRESFIKFWRHQNRPSAGVFRPSGKCDTSAGRGSFSSKRSLGSFSNIAASNLLTASLFTVGSCGLLYFVSPFLFNKTPLKYFKKRPDHLVYLIIGLNIGVFLLWKAPMVQAHLYDFFVMRSAGMADFSIWQMIGATFSHKDFTHILCNMIAIQSFGTALCSFIGPANFFSLYLCSGIVGSWFSMALPALLNIPAYAYSLGASGAAFGVLGCFSWFFPTAGISLFFISIPGGAWVAFVGSILINGAGVIGRWGGIDYAAHLGGSVVGLFFGSTLAKKLKKYRW
ncbi:rhomboid protease [Saccharomycopsis crataegensis]|uniref:Rhomboid protease n=1 Tax=Saccharomycopsis crataegensis TaxID=43959 RepID=A0AAV5QLN9_9ASCO|nr:rhomboid protease [Saccharomycopsis crataegensis]